MLLIREYQESGDASAVGRLIADTFSEYNLTFAPTEERDQYLGPFQFARSMESEPQAAIEKAIQADAVYIAETDGQIAGVLRGQIKKYGRILSLYVRGEYQWHGIGRKLVERFEQDCKWDGICQIRLASSLYAIPFYYRLGYKRSTGVRSGSNMEGRFLIYQPMQKKI